MVALSASSPPRRTRSAGVRALLRPHSQAASAATPVDLLDLSLVAKQAHWNLYGPRFRSLHLQLDEVVITARAFADTVAERAAALAVSPDGRAATIAGTSGVPPFPSGRTKDGDTVEAAVRTFAAVIERVRARAEETGPVDAVARRTC